MAYEERSVTAKSEVRFSSQSTVEKAGDFCRNISLANYSACCYDQTFLISYELETRVGKTQTAISRAGADIERRTDN